MYEWFVLRGIKRPACRFDSSGFCVWEEEHLTSAKSRIMGELLEEAQVQSFNSRHVMLLYIFNSHNGVELYWKTCRNQRILCIDPNYRCTVSWSFCCIDTPRQFLVRLSSRPQTLWTCSPETLGYIFQSPQRSICGEAMNQLPADLLLSHSSPSVIRCCSAAVTRFLRCHGDQVNRSIDTIKSENHSVLNISFHFLMRSYFHIETDNTQSSALRLCLSYFSHSSRRS